MRIARPSYRNLVLLVASLLFYVWGEGAYVLVMLAIIAVNYGLGRRVLACLLARNRAKITVAVAVAVNLGLLIAFKYSNFLVDQLNVVLSIFHVANVKLAPVHLPLGISFFTFHALSYVIDIHRRKSQGGQATRLCPLHDACFRTRSRARSCDTATSPVRLLTASSRSPGLPRESGGSSSGWRRRCSWPTRSRSRPMQSSRCRAASSTSAWPGWESLATRCRSTFDFSGYSDMAIGLAKLFGIDFLENFNYPYSARSITDFWRRWHISLSTWFRDYLYIPLGGNRCSPVRNYANLVTVFFLCGLWHGASWTFAAWGLFHGAFLVLERMKPGRMIDSLWSPVRHLYTLLVVSVGWVLFRADTVPQATAFLKAMAGLGSGAGLEYHVGLYIDSQLVLALVAGADRLGPVAAASGQGQERRCIARATWHSRRGALMRALPWWTSRGTRCSCWLPPCCWPRAPTTPSFTSGSEMIRRVRLLEKVRRRPSQVFQKGRRARLANSLPRGLPTRHWSPCFWS